MFYFLVGSIRPPRFYQGDVPSPLTLFLSVSSSAHRLTPFGCFLIFDMVRSSFASFGRFLIGYHIKNRGLFEGVSLFHPIFIRVEYVYFVELIELIGCDWFDYYFVLRHFESVFLKFRCVVDR